ncbi:MAG: HIT family protein [Desulfosudaceae bacterium]
MYNFRWCFCPRLDRGIRKRHLPDRPDLSRVGSGAAAGQEIFHVHLHVFPRFKNDGFQLRFAAHKPTRTELDVAAEKIRNQL